MRLVSLIFSGSKVLVNQISQNLQYSASISQQKNALLAVIPYFEVKLKVK